MSYYSFRDGVCKKNNIKLYRVGNAHEGIKFWSILPPVEKNERLIKKMSADKNTLGKLTRQRTDFTEADRQTITDEIKTLCKRK